MVLERTTYEQGPIRPPSEAESLLLRLTRNCPWNRCLFCPVYKGQKYSRRSTADIIQDIETISRMAEAIRELSFNNGYGGEINRQALALVQAVHPEMLHLALWLFQGGKTAFLQDGDSLLLPVADLETILKLLKEKFSTLECITTYARSKTILRRSVDDLIRLRAAGLNRIHVGMESGNDAVLELMKKGVNGEEHFEAGRRVKESGISLSEYVILGLGGADLWREHALDTAKILNRINPDYIRVRTLAIPPISPLYNLVEEGQFGVLSDDDIIREEALFIENLDKIDSYFFSDHILNLLEEVQGKFPEDKPFMLETIRHYLALPGDEREIFRLGRRSGYFRRLTDLGDDALRSPVENVYRQIKLEGISLENYIKQIMLRFI